MPVPFDLLDAMRGGEFEKVVVCNEPSVGLQAIVSIHSTVLGPANGGVRMLPYASWEAAAADALRLSRAMTYKWAAAGENRGGGKSVIVGDPTTDKSEALLRAFGRFVDQFGGEYYVGEDVGITLADMEVIHLETDYVATLPVEAGGVGDIAPHTARGVIQAMRACAERVWGTSDLAGRTVALQGLGACGSAALELLLGAGATVTVTDVDPAKLASAARQPGVTTCAPDAIYGQRVDIFAPFALGGVINADTIGQLQAKVVCGSANNIFADERYAAELEARGIVYAVDFIANAGGAIFDAEQFRKGGFSKARAERNVSRIYDRTRSIFALAEQRQTTCYRAAFALAEQRLQELGPLRRG